MATTAPTSNSYAALAAALANLKGAIAQQVRGPELDGVVQLALYRPDADRDSRKVLLDVWARDGTAGAWRTGDRRRNRTPQGSFTMFLRKHLIGQRLQEVRALSDGIALGWQRRETPMTWLIAWRGPRKGASQLAWIDGRGRCRPVWPGRVDAGLVDRVRAAPAAPPMEPTAGLAVEARAQRLAKGQTAQQSAQGEGSALRRMVRATHRRQRRLVQALEGDAARAGQADTLREQGEVLKISLDRVPSGADSVVLDVPWKPGQSVTIALKRDLAPAANLARIFRRARAFAKRIDEIEARLSAARATLAGLEQLLEACLQPDADADDLQQRAAALGVGGARQQVPESAKSKRKPQGLPAGIARYRSPAGREVLLGRSATANDKLVTRLARGCDVWMHVRGRPGAHLLLRCEAKRPRPPVDELLACAALVAWGSGVKRGDRVDVTWTHARHVRKAKGSAPGLVYIAEEHTLYAEVDSVIIDAFRATRG